MNQPEPRYPIITVMTSRDSKLIYEVLKASCGGSRRQMPPGVNGVDDVVAVMRGGVAFFVAYDESKPVGAIGYRWERGTLKIFHVAVNEAYQRLGVGRRLVQAVESMGFALGTTNVTLEVAREMEQHLPFERFGYKPTAAADRHEGRMHMTKALHERVR